MKFLVALLTALPAISQSVCPTVSAFALCEISLPGVPRDADLRGEFRSPSHRTLLVRAFWNGAQMAMRVSPTEPGVWDYRLSDGKSGQFTAGSSDSQGFIEAANVHHFAYSGSRKPHLWMGDTVPVLDAPGFDRLLASRADLRFNHLRAAVLNSAAMPSDAFWIELDRRIALINGKGITADLVIARDGNDLTKLFADRAARERFITFLVARYGAMNVTWQIFDNFETYDRGRELTREIGGYLRTMDTYRHLITTGSGSTSSPLLDDGWMTLLSYRSTDGVVPAIEHQLYKYAGVVDFRGDDQFRQRLWTATMAGAYPQSSAPDEESAKQMKVWFDVMSNTRHWDLEPYFDLTNGKCLALEGVEYVAYIEHPGPVSITIEKHGYDAEWINPVNGETFAIKMKNVKQDIFSTETPDNAHDWVLHLAREGEKKNMLKSYRFEAREVTLQEVEYEAAKLPFEIVQPAADTISLANPGQFAIKLKKETRATKTMQFMWTGEVAADEQSYRVIGIGADGALRIPANLAMRFPAVLHLRVTGMNAYGKVFVSERNVQLTK